MAYNVMEEAMDEEKNLREIPHYPELVWDTSKKANDGDAIDKKEQELLDWAGKRAEKSFKLNERFAIVLRVRHAWMYFDGLVAKDLKIVDNQGPMPAMRALTKLKIAVEPLEIYSLNSNI